MKIALTLIILSLAMIGISISLDPFRLGPDGSYPFLSVPQGDSDAYHMARNQALTSKYLLQDYGATTLAIGLAVAMFSWRPLKAPASRLGFCAIAVAAPLVTAFGLVFDLVQGQARWEFPPWADSLGIPLMGVPALFIAGLVWAFAHFVLLVGVLARSGRPISLAVIRQAHPWILIVCVLTALLMIGMGAEGAYWYAIPGAIWLYFYASIAAVRQHHA